MAQGRTNRSSESKQRAALCICCRVHEFQSAGIGIDTRLPSFICQLPATRKLRLSVRVSSGLEVEQSLGVAAGNLHAVGVADRDLIEPFFGLNDVLERVVN